MHDVVALSRFPDRPTRDETKAAEAKITNASNLSPGPLLSASKTKPGLYFYAISRMGRCSSSRLNNLLLPNILPPNTPCKNKARSRSSSRNVEDLINGAVVCLDDSIDRFFGNDMSKPSSSGFLHRQRTYARRVLGEVRSQGSGETSLGECEEERTP